MAQIDRKRGQEAIAEQRREAHRPRLEKKVRSGPHNQRQQRIRSHEEIQAGQERQD